MDTARRQRYLHLLGIETWALRGTGGVTAAPSVEEPEPPAAIREPMPRKPRPAVPPPAAATPTAMIAAAPAAAAPREVPADWSGLRATVKDCQACKLCATRTQTVFGVGSETSPLMVVGEGPGADEDAQGEPFVGRAGKLLDEMLKAIGRSRKQAAPEQAVFIANVVKCRPPGNRDPEADEVEACRPYLDRQIELVKPKLIVALGRVAAQRLLATDAPLSRLRGPLHRYGPTQTPVFVTYHPAYLLRSPREKAKSWEDLKRIHRHLAEPA
ncbi:uracil-DNA glycosylase [Sinimarinibacterium flocculans]|uniref:Type-4 uracil-DNA glycosylase n=2 Tax=Sinimarinibacterium flocculans TaxID=985250 RepID=A0A318E4F8_9GAMM|nr:uracil-DNA glycosylase [Sinimarinibacterium flocculans]PXV66101.1 DNA polymerase [Sinimarinibacterium flocculans]